MVLDRLVDLLRARDLCTDGEAHPAAILWTDPRREWEGLLDLLRSRVEEILILGEYAPEKRTGPSIWIRCLVDRAILDPSLPADRPPIVYLPGVSRQELRAGEDCKAELRPLVELMHRWAMWLHPNGSDWTVSAFLASPRSLGLELARDQETAAALLRALPELAMIPVADLSGKLLAADDFDRLVVTDPSRDLLRWMGDPEGTRARLDTNRWAAFCARTREEMGFDPAREADVVAGERLGLGEGDWKRVWDRFQEAPGSYPGIAELLRRSRPGADLFVARERWPDINDDDEASLRKALDQILDVPHGAACDGVLRFEEEHRARRGWVWARMGLAPMAEVLEPLARLARAAGTAIGGSTPDEVASCYRERGWAGDAAAWQAVAMAKPRDEELVADLVRHLLLPWLEESAHALQAAAQRSPFPGAGAQPVVEAGENMCLFFADGLRYDVAQVLATRLEGRGCRVTVGHRWAALPTVTATAKPAVTPVAERIAGNALGEDFAPTLEAAGRQIGAAELRGAIAARGYQVLGEGLLDAPMSQPARGWVEFGAIDGLGHKLGARLAGQLTGELERIAERIIALLDAGWRSVRVVTDHGWLLVPGGLPKADLPRHLTACRWARCAVIAGESTPDVPRWPWHWNGSQWFAAAPGVACFNRSEEYAHGGISIQECLTPDLLVERTESGRVAVTVSSITWRGLRCFIVAAVRGGEVMADLRLEHAAGESVVQTPKRLEADGAASLVLKDDRHEEASLVLVLLDDTGKILSQKPTRVGTDT